MSSGARGSCEQPFRDGDLRLPPVGSAGGQRRRSSARGFGEQRRRRRGRHLEGDAPGAHDDRLDPELGPARGLLPDLLDRADEAPDPPLVEGHAGRGPPAASAACSRSKRRREVGLVLAARARRARASATRSPGRARRPSHARSSTSRRSRYASGVHDPAGVPAVGELDDRPRAPGRPCRRRTPAGAARCSAGGSTTAPSAWWYSPSKVSGSPPSRPVHDLDRLAQPVDPHARAAASSMPIASYSGSYQPAPSPTSRRPPVDAVERRERLGRARVGGRSASQQHERAEAQPRHDAGERGERGDRLERAERLRAARRTSRGRGRGGRRARASR